jgi:hypothetical protein
VVKVFVLCIQRSFELHLCYLFQLSPFTPDIKPTSRLTTHFSFSFSFLFSSVFLSLFPRHFIYPFVFSVSFPYTFFIERLRVPLKPLLPANARSSSSVRLTLHLHDFTSRPQAILWLFREISSTSTIHAGPQPALQTRVQVQFWTEF